MKQLLYVLFFLPFCLFAQTEALEELKGLPTNEVFDLLIDKKGFLWVAHDLGLSRFDGLAFTHFNNPQTQSFSTFDLVEDKQGKIWCHNLVGQVFYVDKEEMHLYTPYDPSSESLFTRMTILNSELVITSDKGLFVCETATLKGRYIHCVEDPLAATNTLSVYNDKVLALSNENFYCYDPKIPSSFRKISFKNFSAKKNPFAFISPCNTNSSYLATNPEGILAKVDFNNKELIISEVVKSEHFINGVSEVNGNRWIHTKRISISNNNEKIEGYNISDIVMDKEGNLWCSSLEKGLLVRYKNKLKKIRIPLEKNDIVRRVIQYKDLVIYGTQKGKISLQHHITGKVINEISLPSGVGAIEYLKILTCNYLFIGTSDVSYLLNLTNNKIRILDVGGTVKDVEVTPSAVYFATSDGINKIEPVKGFDFLSNKNKYVVEQRARAVRFNPVTKELLVAIKNGLFLLKNEKLHPVLYNSKQIYASSIEVYKNSFFISSHLNGLFTLKDGIVKNIGIEQGLSSKIILRLRLLGNVLWLLGPSLISAIDIEKEKVFKHTFIPNRPGIQFFDVAEMRDSVLVTTNEGMFSIPLLKSSNKIVLNNYLLSVQVNNKKANVNEKLVLPYDRSDIQLFLSVPFFTNPEQIYFKYRLTGSNNNQWITGGSNQNIFRYASLAPGNYRFEAVAFHPQFGKAVNPIIYEFHILSPWYKRWWFITLTIIAACSLIILIWKIRISQILREENLRRKIAVDLHDDIGSTLSSINIYSELARKEKNYHHYIQSIQQQTQNVITNLDELVWNINPKNDNAHALIEKLKTHAFSILPAKGIICRFNSNGLNLGLSSIKRRHILFAFKEIINNVAKHSESTICTIDIGKKGKKIEIVVTDDGKGFIVSAVQHERNGLQNLAIRARELKGSFAIVSEPGKGTIIRLCFPI